MHNLCFLEGADQAIGTFFVRLFSLLKPARVLCLIPTSISIHFHWIRKVIIMRTKKIYRRYCIVEHQIFRGFVYGMFCVAISKWDESREKQKSVSCAFSLFVMIPSVYFVECCERNPRTQRKAGEVNGTLNRWFSCGFCCALVSILYQLRSRVFSAFLSKMAFCKRPPFWSRTAGRAWERDCMFDAKIWNLCIHEWRLVHTCIRLLRSTAY